jgi:hypothetical protein
LRRFSDIDSVADPSEQDVITRRFLDWAARNDFFPVISCNHLPGSLLLVAAAADGRLVELHLVHRAILRGAVLFEAAELEPMMVADPRGFRRLRTGAEGLMLFFHNGITKSGSPDRGALETKGILKMIQEDPHGADLAAQVFGGGAGNARKAVAAAGRGEWSRSAILFVEIVLALRALRRPSLLASRIAFRVAGAAYCPVLAALQSGRRTDSTQEEWLQNVRRSHPVLNETGGCDRPIERGQP